MTRITKPEKWKDAFFLNLRPYDKLVFIYLYENCDDAGFFDLNFDRMVNDIGIKKEEIASALKNIEKTFIMSVELDRIWIKKFLLHQNKLPLNLKTTDGNYIKFQIEGNIPKFNNPKEFQSVISNVSKRGKIKTEFEKPTLDDVINNFKDGEWSYITREEIEGLYDYYESVGWKVGNKKMADYKKAFINCFRRNMHRYPRPNTNGRVTQKQNTQQTRMDMIAEGNEKIAGFDYNTLKKS